MKRVVILILAVVLGGVVALGIFYSLDSRQQPRSQGIHYLDDLSSTADITYAQEGRKTFPDFTETSEKVMDAVVHVQTSVTVRRSREQLPEPFRDFFGDEFYDYFFGPRQDGQGQEAPRQRRRGAGSGVILNESGYIVTSNHVVANADQIQVTLSNNQTFQAEVIGTDPSTDLAVIKIDGDDHPYIALVDSDSLRVGEWVLAIGNPFNLTSTVTAGIVSAKARNINIMQDQYAIESFIQTDAAINPGNSGGALVNLQGGLVGINTAIASPTGAYTGYGFAVPSNIVGKIVTDIMEYGTVQRGYLGVVIRNVNSELAREENLKVSQGVYIDSVLENSAAAKANIREGDVITSIDGEEINRSAQLLEKIAQHRPGEEVEIVVNRNGRSVETTATLQSREGRTTAMTRERGEVLGRLGAEFENISRQTARELGIPGGVRVRELHAGILSQQTEMREGFIITRVNNQEVTSLEEFISLMERLTGGVMLEGVYEDARGTYYYAFGL
ncbi:MAG: Do family serine endopeptidase [Bacteroidales bacterium]